MRERGPLRQSSLTDSRRRDALSANANGSLDNCMRQLRQLFARSGPSCKARRQENNAKLQWASQLWNRATVADRRPAQHVLRGSSLCLAATSLSGHMLKLASAPDNETNSTKRPAPCPRSTQEETLQDATAVAAPDAQHPSLNDCDARTCRACHTHTDHLGSHIMSQDAGRKSEFNTRSPRAGPDRCRQNFSLCL